MSRRLRRERGAIAIVVAISAVMIFTMAAFAVDLGNAFARKRDIQTQADLAAIAAGDALPYSAASDAAIRADATSYASGNLTLGQDTGTWDFSDSNRYNGYLELSTSNPNVMTLHAPSATVEFGLGSLLGFENIDVTAQATVEIRSPGAALPFYVAESCSQGLQTFIDTATGHNNPVLAPASVGNPASTLSSITPISTPSATAPPTGITILGGSLLGVTEVGFTTDDGVYPHVSIPKAQFTTHTDTQISFPLPAAVYDHDIYWYVRVAEVSGASTKWTPVDEALGFTVGNPYIKCDGSISGNFGLLKLSREDSGAADWDNLNILRGIQRTLTKWPNSTPPTDCGGDSLAVQDPYHQQVFTPSINCLSTYPGLPSQGASEGLIGKGGVDGRLAKEQTTPGCDPSGGDEEFPLVNFDGNNDYDINNDVLSCFFTNTSVTVADVTLAATPSSAVGVIDPKIFDSPRFFWVPVLKDDPSGGRSGRYPILRFQPMFLTGQPLSATKAVPGGVTANGLTVTTSGLGEIKAIMINPTALPVSAIAGKTGTVAYLGVGTKVTTLVR